MLDTVDFNHVQHISFTQSRLTDAVSVILSELLSYEHPSNDRGIQKHKYYFLDLNAYGGGEWPLVRWPVATVRPEWPP